MLEAGEPLFVGAAEVDITPPVGTYLQGALVPRTSEGLDDPLYVKALVMKQGKTTIAHLTFDIAVIDRELVLLCAESIRETTGIPADNVICTATHTHSGPVTSDYIFPPSMGNALNEVWREALPGRAARAASQADQSLSPARPSMLRTYCHGISHYRRLEFTDGRQLNTWLLNRDEDDVQCVGAAGPVDPELIAMSFEDDAGRVIAVVVSYALHANSRGKNRNYLSADYPGELTRSLRERLGNELICLVLPAAGGNLNPTCPRSEIAKALSNGILEKWQHRRVLDCTAGPLGFTRSSVHPVLRDFSIDQTDRIRDSQWPQEHHRYFTESREHLLSRRVADVDAPLAAWCLGNTSFVTQPGELFVEYGMDLKRRGPFDWTIPVAYTDDSLGYLVTEAAWEAGGYESLVARQAIIAPQGCGAMVTKSIEMLNRLHADAP